MTKDEWDEVAKALSRSFGYAELMVDGYWLSLYVKQDRMKLVIITYVNGEMKGAWLMDDCEERRRFMRPVKRPLYHPKQKALILKDFGKRAVRKHFPRLDETFTWWTPHWPSFAPLKRHLVANNKSIERVSQP